MLNMALDIKTLDRLYREKILKDKSKITLSFWDLFKAFKKGVTEISLENEEEYNYLPKDQSDHKKYSSKEVDDFTKRLEKFIDIN